MTAAFLCASLGIVPTVLRDDDRAIIRAASAASKAADYLLALQADADEPESPSGLAIPASAPESQREASVP